MRGMCTCLATTKRPDIGDFLKPKGQRWLICGAVPQGAQILPDEMREAAAVPNLAAEARKGDEVEMEAKTPGSNRGKAGGKWYPGSSLVVEVRQILDLCS